jgi:MFS transporter, FSR family, fosmidomycin resistance protein
MALALERRPAALDAAAGPDRGGLLMLGAGHFVVDMTVGGLAPLIPVLTTTFTLSDFQASMILGASTFSSSAIQPIFGWLADRRPAAWLLWGGVAVAALFFALAGFASSYLLVLACIVGSGLGVAAYHPEAARVANGLAGRRKASGVAWFMTGGNLGFALGPLAVGLVIPLLDARATVAALVPGAAVTGLLLARSARVALPITPHAVARARRAAAHVRAFALLIVVTSMRTWTLFGILLLAPLVLKEERGWSDEATSVAIFGVTMAATLGTIVGSALADRIGGRLVLAWSLGLAAPLGVGFLYAPTAAGVAMLVVLGFLIMASMSVTVVMGQAYLPGREALAAGLMVGFASIGVATPGLALVGAVSDVAGRGAALWLVAAFPLVGGALALLLPRPRAAS